MKKVGILSIHYGTWMPGPSLQAASLSWAIKQMGYEVEHIDFIPTRKKPVSQTALKVEHRNRFSENPEVFEEFRKNWVPRSETVYRSLEDLEKGTFDYDIIVVGSDSVWSPAATGNFLPAYFLHFIPDTVKKVSYAASFGQTDWDSQMPSKELLNALKTYIHRYEYIGIREPYAVQQLKQMVNVPVMDVLEPSLIVDKSFFENMLPENPKTTIPQIAYHKILKDDTFSDKLSILEEQLSLTSENIYNYPVEKNEDIKYYYNTMPDWLYKLFNCELVVTDSFHCLCLAIHFEKNFFFLPSEEESELLNCPSKNILTKLGLLDRICFTYNDVLEKSHQNESINYNDINLTLTLEVQKSLSFLEKSLSSL